MTENTPQPPPAANANGATRMGTLLDAAAFNLDIAQQYIDESRFVIEHWLINFHYAITLLARYRNDPVRRGEAARSLLAIVNPSQKPKLPDHHDGVSVARLVAEAHYNLGVCHELDGTWDLAAQSYVQAAEIARSQGEALHPVLVFAQIGFVSVRVAALREASVHERLAGQAPQSASDANVIAAIQEIKARLESWREARPTSLWGLGSESDRQPLPRDILDRISRRVADFELELAKTGKGDSR